MDISNIIKLQCSSCGKQFYALLRLGIYSNEGVFYEAFSSRNSPTLIFFKPTKKESNYFYYEETEHRAWKAHPELDIRRTNFKELPFEVEDTHKYDPVFKCMRSCVTVAECIHCDNEASITEILNSNEFLDRGGQIIGLESVN